MAPNLRSAGLSRSPEMKQRSRADRLLVLGLSGVGTAAALVALVSHGYTGSFSRFLADDFCTFGSLQRLGFLGSQVDWYLHWSGRFAFTWMITSLHLVGPEVTPWLGGTLTAAWILGSFVLFRAVTRWRLQGPGLLGLVSLAASSCLLVYSLAPDIYQALYWQTGSITYSVPLVLLMVQAAWILGGGALDEEAPSKSTLLLAFGLALVISGFSETIGLVQTVGLGLLALWFGTIRPHSDRLARMLWLAFLGSSLGLLIVAAAPGNAVRQALMPEPSSIPQVLSRAVRDAYLFSYSIVKWSWPALLLSGLAPAAWALLLLRDRGSQTLQNSKPSWPMLIGLPPLAFVLLVVVMFPSEFALSSYPDGRVLVTAAAIVVFAIMLWSTLLARRFSVELTKLSRLPAASIIPALLLAILSLQVSLRAVVTDRMILADARDYAAAWDRRHEQVRAASAEGVGSMEVASLTHMGGLAEIEVDPNVWINRCFAQSYGLRRVSAK